MQSSEQFAASARPNYIDRLFSPITVGNIELRNRIMSASHATYLADRHLATERLAQFYGARARGGVGSIVTEAIRVHPSTLAHSSQIAGFDDRVVPGLRRIAEVVHEHGAAIFGQVLHHGRQYVNLDSHLATWAPSSLPCPRARETPHEMTTREIVDVTEGFVATASNLKQAGFDGVELHAGHGFLIQQFLSPYTNTRTDSYGGTSANRSRFLMELLSRIRSKVGPDFVLGLRISADEFTDGGMGLEDMREVAASVDKTGLADFMSVSQSNFSGYSFTTMMPDMHFPRQPFVYLAASIKQVVRSMPVCAVGRIAEPFFGGDLLADGQADIICLCRPLIVDPDLPNKLQAGQADDLRPCLYCNECVGSIHSRSPIVCVVNPDLGYESDHPYRLAVVSGKAKRVVVVGGGPAGLAAAYAASSRGHSVVLLEKEDHFGGQVRTAMRAPGRSELGRSVEFLEKQLMRLRVEVALGVEANLDVLSQMSPNTVVIATGSDPLTPEIEGALPGQVISAKGLIERGMDIPKEIVFIDDDGHFYGTSIAEYLLDHGARVQIVTRMASVGLDIPSVSVYGALHRLHKKLAILHPYSRVSRVQGRMVFISSVFQPGRTTAIDGVDMIVACVGGRPRSQLIDRAQSRFQEVYAVGDCVAPRRLLNAVHDGYRVGRAI